MVTPWGTNRLRLAGPLSEDMEYGYEGHNHSAHHVYIEHQHPPLLDTQAILSHLPLIFFAHLCCK